MIISIVYSIISFICIAGISFILAIHLFDAMNELEDTIIRVFNISRNKAMLVVSTLIIFIGFVFITVAANPPFNTNIEKTNEHFRIR